MRQKTLFILCRSISFVWHFPRPFLSVRVVVTGPRQNNLLEKFGQSPNGWHSGGFPHSTVGNNGHVKSDSENRAFEIEGSYSFDFPLDQSLEPDTYVLACLTQLFVSINELHDLLYVYGFDEARFAVQLCVTLSRKSIQEKQKQIATNDDKGKEVEESKSKIQIVKFFVPCIAGGALGT